MRSLRSSRSFFSQRRTRPDSRLPRLRFQLRRKDKPLRARQPSPRVNTSPNRKVRLRGSIRERGALDSLSNGLSRAGQWHPGVARSSRAGAPDFTSRGLGEVSDGWFGVNVTPDQAKAKVERMRQYAQAVGRDPAALHFSVSASIDAPVGLDQVKRYRDAAWIRW